MDTRFPSFWQPLGQDGFTLLETMVAVAIMMVAFAAILMVQSGSINTTQKGNTANVVAMLIKRKMIEVEQSLEGKTFDEIKKEDGGQYPAPWENYRWTRKIDEVTFPKFQIPAALASAGGAPDSANQSADGVNRIMSILTTFLSKALREVTLTVFWKKGDKEQNFSVTTYWVNLNNDLSITE